MGNEYTLRTVKRGEFDDQVSLLSKEGWYVREVLKEADHFFVVLERWQDEEVEELEESQAEELWRAVSKLSRKVAALHEILRPDEEEVEDASEE